MADERFDAIVIGAGAGGLTVAIGLSTIGRTVALVEANRVGGDCTNTGCIPSKRLIHLARTGFGQTGADRLADVRATRDRVRAGEEHELAATPNLTLIRGSASLLPGPRVVVAHEDGERRLVGKDVVIATGSRPAHVPIAGLPADRLLTSESLFEQESPPSHLVIVGAGAVGLEMAGAFSRLGSRVTVVESAERVLPGAPERAATLVAVALARAGIDMHLSTRVTGFDAHSARLDITGPAGPAAVHDVDRVLVAAGRRANIEGLGLEAVGLPVEPAGLEVDTWGRTALRHVWAVGDVTVGSRQTHAANAAGRRVVQRLAYPWLPPIGRAPTIPSAVFTEPEVAWVGPDEARLERRYGARAVLRISVEFADIDRGTTDGIRDGYVAIDALRGTGRILAATVVGPSASDLIATLTLAIDRKVSLLSLARMSYAYPTFAAAIGKAADEFARRTLGNVRGELGALVRRTFRVRQRGASG